MPTFLGNAGGNAAGLLGRLAARTGHRERIAFHDGSRVATHGELHALGARIASVLAGLGVGRGTRVLLGDVDGIRWVATFLAIGRLGALAVLVNPLLPEPEVRAVRNVVRPVLVLGRDPQGEEAVDTAWLERTAERAVEHPAVPVGADAALYVQFSSGTTGPPKGAVHRHGDLAHHHAAVGERMLAIGPDDVSLSISKLHFAYGFGNSLVYPLFSGSSAVLLPGRPDPGTVAEAVRRHGVTVLHAVPSALAHLSAEADPSAFGTVRVAVSAGERLPTAVGERARGLLGAPVLDELGSTEVGGAWCANTLSDDCVGTVGRPLHGFRIDVRDDADQPVPDGVEGQLWVTGPTVLTGYLDQPGATAEVLRSGWLATRDKGVRRTDGRFVHTGRSDDVEVVGGLNVAPAEIEDLIGGHEAVREVAVAAVPDERGATRLRAFVVPVAGVAGVADAERLGAELVAMVRSRLAPFKVPRSVDVVGSLPRTATGKLRRHVVRTGRW